MNAKKHSIGRGGVAIPGETAGSKQAPARPSVGGRSTPGECSQDIRPASHPWARLIHTVGETQARGSAARRAAAERSKRTRKLSFAQAEYARGQYRDGRSMHAIARELEVGYHTIRGIVQGKTYKCE